MSELITYDVYWEGPYSIADIIHNEINDEAFVHAGHCLYQIYGDHPCYGRGVLLYIGKTDAQGVITRIKQHSERFTSQCEEVKVFIASCHEFIGWKERSEILQYNLIDSTVIDIIETLLIYAHQPSYNSSKLKSPRVGLHMRVFNTGRRKSLLPEISTDYWLVV